MGRLDHDQGQLFYSFCLEEIVPDDHLVRSIAAVLDLSWVTDPPNAFGLLRVRCERQCRCAEQRDRPSRGGHQKP